MSENLKDVLETIKESILKDDESVDSFLIDKELWKELLNYITKLQKENEFLKLNNPEMNIEHFRIVKENKRKIDNLRKENEELKELNVCVGCENNPNYKKRIDKAIKYIKEEGTTYLNLANQRKWCSEFSAENILKILGGDEE